MKKVLIISTLGIILGLMGCQQKKDTKMQAEAKPAYKATEEALVCYTCPMDAHKHITSAEAGKCAECGMDLVAVVSTDEKSAEFYACSMAEHIHDRSHEPGTCAACGMALKPMRLKKL